MSEKLNLARIKKFGQNFEISVNPEAALKYKKGIISDLREAVLADSIFTDARKGLIASDKDLRQAFGTTDHHAVADKIVKEGEIQHTAEHRSQEREQRWKKLINMISRQAVDPRTGFPHPPNRIEAALEQGKIHLDDHRTVEEQFAGIISQLRPILPIRIEQKQIEVTLPAAYAGKAYNAVKSNSKVLNERWNVDGSYTAKVEIPAGFYPEFLDKLNSVTRGEVVVKE